MKLKSMIVIWIFILGFLSASALGAVAAEKPKPFTPDKALCAKMLRFGKEAYMRGKYLDAKEYFRKAIQADPTSQTAWRYYDQAVIFALAEKVEKDAGLLLPGKSERFEQSVTGAEAPPSPPVQTETKKEPEFKIVEDEGC